MILGRGGRPRPPPNYIRGAPLLISSILSLSLICNVLSQWFLRLVLVFLCLQVVFQLDLAALALGVGVPSSHVCLVSRRLFTFRLFIFLFCGGAPSLFKDSCLHLAQVLLTPCYIGITLLRYCFSDTPALLLAWWSLIIGLLSLAISYIYIPIYLARYTLLGVVWIY